MARIVERDRRRPAVRVRGDRGHEPSGPSSSRPSGCATWRRSSRTAASTTASWPSSAPWRGSCTSCTGPSSCCARSIGTESVKVDRTRRRRRGHGHRPRAGRTGVPAGPGRPVQRAGTAAGCRLPRPAAGVAGHGRSATGPTSTSSRCATRSSSRICSPRSLSHTRIPKVCLPRYEDWGDILRWLLTENVPGLFPLRRRRVSPQARGRGSDAHVRRRGRARAHQSPLPLRLARACRPRACPPPSTR